MAMHIARSGPVVQDGVVGLVDALAHVHGASLDGELDVRVARLEAIV